MSEGKAQGKGKKDQDEKINNVPKDKKKVIKDMYPPPNTYLSCPYTTRPKIQRFWGPSTNKVFVEKHFVLCLICLPILGSHSSPLTQVH